MSFGSVEFGNELLYSVNFGVRGEVLSLNGYMRRIWVLVIPLRWKMLVWPNLSRERTVYENNKIER